MRVNLYKCKKVNLIDMQVFWGYQMDSNEPSECFETNVSLLDSYFFCIIYVDFHLILLIHFHVGFTSKCSMLMSRFYNL